MRNRTSDYGAARVCKGINLRGREAYATVLNITIRVPAHLRRKPVHVYCLIHLLRLERWRFLRVFQVDWCTTLVFTITISLEAHREEVRRESFDAGVINGTPQWWWWPDKEFDHGLERLLDFHHRLTIAGWMSCSLHHHSWYGTVSIIMPSV